MGCFGVGVDPHHRKTSPCVSSEAAPVGYFRSLLGELRNFFAAEGPGGLNIPGTRTSYQEEFQQLVRQRIDPHFIAMGPAGEVDQLAMSGDFQAWYDAVLPSLMTEPVRGQIPLASSDPRYSLLRDSAQGDHPLYASVNGGFYSDAA